jgi:hypothetical protein
LDTGKLLQLARKAVGLLRDEVNKGGFRPQIRVLVKHKVREFEITEKSSRYSTSFEPYEKSDWSTAVHELIEKRVKPLTLFKELTDTISAEYRNDLIAKGYNLPSQVEFWLSNFVSVVLYEELEGTLTEERLLDIIATFKSELDSGPHEYDVKAFINGVNLKVESINLDNGILLRKPKPVDLEYEHDAYFPMWQEPLHIPNAILEVKMRAVNELQVYEKIEQVIMALRLFHLGSIHTDVQFESQKTVIWPIGLVRRGHGQMLASAYSYTIDAPSAMVLKKFWDCTGTIIPMKITDKRHGSLYIALTRYNNALLESVEVERNLMTAVMGLEALYVLSGERGEMSFRLSLRTAKLLGLLGSDPLEVCKVLEESYIVRSKVGHGLVVSNVARTKIGDLLKKILEYLRKSVTFFVLGSKIMSKGDWVSLLDKSMIDHDSFEQLKSKVEACLRDFPREVMER